MIAARPSLWGLVTRVPGRIAFGAPCPQRSLAREASTLSLVTCHAGSSRHGIDPVGETSNVPDTPLGTRSLVFLTFTVRESETFHGRPKRKAEEASQAQDSQPKPRKPRQRSVPVPVPASAATLNIINPDAAGIDVHSNMHMVCVPADRDANPVRQFGANTVDLHEIVAWLKQCRIKTVALESTGVYWIALFELLESEGFEVSLVEPGQLSRCGRGPRPTCWTRSGFNACIPTVSCVRRFGLRIRCWPCVPTGGSGRCWSATPPVMSSTCRRPWRR